ncbi:MAG: hypothetical protein OEV15_00810 [Gallionella sp.]|nr:hypothetical protein [Gallionella sp.]
MSTLPPCHSGFTDEDGIGAMSLKSEFVRKACAGMAVEHRWTS